MARNVPLNNNRKPQPRDAHRHRTPEKASALQYGYTEREWARLNAQDAVERRKQYKLILIVFLLSLLVLLLSYSVYYAVFRSHDYKLSLPFDKDSQVYGFSQVLSREETAEPFSYGLCVTDGDVGTDQFYSNALSAGLFNMNDTTVSYAKDIFTMRSPASLTKIMTALVALKNSSLDDRVVTTETAKDIEYGSSVCDIHTGDTLTMRQLLYGMLIASGNDAAMMVAEHVGGSVSHFVEMMNQEAARLGATRTHFMNPHGLTDPEHYTCVYDLYLIFREAMKYDIFLDMISRRNYYAEYTNAEGGAVAVTWETTNQYFTGQAVMPEDVIIYGGKTGTTEDAGACLCLMAKDLYGNPYLSIILHSADKTALYEDMNQLLSLIGK